MIVFDLACQEGGHVFEVWFGSTGDYEAQRARGLVACPICGCQAIDKAVMAPNVGTKANRRGLPVAAPTAVAKSGPDTAEATKAMMRMLAQAQARVLESSDYVGPAFADEARAIHAGDSEQRAIHGQTTPDEARALVADGIDVTPLPFPVRPPGADN